MSKTFEQLSVPSWLTDTLSKPPFGFTTSLPVQAAVVPFANRAFSSWMLHCDIGLSSPTGSGKTLCYCLPLLHAVVEQRKRFAGGFPDRHIRGVIVVPTSVLAEQVNDVLQALAGPAEVVVGTLFRAADDGSSLTRWLTVQNRNGQRRKRFGAVDVVVATPQKLCSWMESLADEDDELLQQQQQLPDQSNNNNNNNSSSSNKGTVADVFGRTQVVVLDEADDLLSTSSFTSMAGRIVETVQDAVTEVGETVLHKMLCSATLTSRISKVSDVKLQNARYYSLDAGGSDLSSRVLGRAGADSAATAKRGVDTVRPLFPLPSSLVEHLVIVRDDAKRHVTLLTTVRHALADLQQKATAIAAAAAVQSDAAADSAEAGQEAQQQQQQRTSSSWRTNSSGNSVIVFCQTAEVARVMGHFLATAGVNALELTTLTSEAERRQAALAVATASSSEQKVIVVSDALMRGIDMPGVGAVVQYEPPTTLQQYIHRVGRTARAGAPGASYVLLSKVGSSGTEADGQVAHFKAFDSMLLRSGKVFNQVKLRELPEEEVVKADEMLAQTQQRLNSLGFFVSAAGAAASSAAAAATREVKKGGQRRNRK